MGGLVKRSLGVHVGSFFLMGALALIGIGAAQAGPYTAAKNNACPEGWEDTGKAIPVIGVPNTPWKDAADESAGLTHITPRASLQTIDALPVTPAHKAADALTVASECLVYRNFEVDTAGYVAPAPTEPNSALGWLPAAIY